MIKKILIFLLITSHSRLLAKPTQVTNLTTLSGNAFVELVWTLNTDISDGDKYEIEISSWSPSSFIFLTEILHPNNTHQATGLINGNTYYFRVRASSGTDESQIGEWSEVVSTTPWVNLGIPLWSDTDSKAISTTTINWSWFQADNASGYRVINSTSGENFSGDLTSSATYWIQSGLTPNTSAEFYIQAFNGLLTKNSTPKKIFTLANPPANFHSPLQPGTTIVNLSWSANNNPPSVRYSIERSSTGISAWTTIASLLSGTTHQDTGLLEKTTYWYRVWAVNSDSRETAKVSVSTRTGSINPQPLTLTLVESWILDGEVRLTFTAPYDDSLDEKVTSYIIKYATYTLTEDNWASPSSSTVPQNITPATPGTGQIHVVTGLYPGTTFYFAMRAVDEVGNQSVISNVLSAPAQDKIPNPPTNISAIATSETNISVSWTLPSFSGFDDRWRYYIYRATFPFTLHTQATFYSWVIHNNNQYDDSSIDNPIRRETTYWYRVATEDLGNGPVGSGLFSIPLGSTTLSSITSLRTPDLSPPPAITNLSALTGITEGRINLTWTSPTDNSVRIGEGAGENIIGGAFRIRWTTNPSEIFSTTTFNVEIPTNTTPGATNSYLITGLVGGNIYYIRIWTRDESHNWSAVSNGATAWAQVDITPPSAITSITLTANWRRINLSWVAPGDDGTTGVLDGKFEIRLSTTSAITDETKWNNVPDSYPYRVVITTSGVSPGSVRFYTITGLTNSTTYYVAIKSADERDNRSVVSTTSPKAVPLNSPPSNFNLSTPANGSEITTYTPQLTWEISSDADSSFGDSIVYNVYYSTSVNFETNITTISPNLSDANYIIPAGHFQEDKRYYWRVSVKDLDNTLRFSSQTFSLITNVYNSTPTAPSPLSPLNNTRISTNTPQLVWSASTDTDILDVLTYRVDYSTRADFSVFVSSIGIATTYYTTPPLIENTTYWWRVFVTDGQLTVQSQATFYFRVNAIAEPPLPFELIAPGENVRKTTTTINFSWQSTSDPDPDESVKYNLIWSLFSNFASSTVVSGLNSTTAQIVVPYDNAYYYWKVEAVGTDGIKQTATPSFRRFYTDIEKQLPQFPQPDLIEPANNTTISTTLRPLFRWNEAIDPDPADTVRYHIEISERSDFSGAVAIPTGTDPYYQPISDLLDQTTYYWRVRAAGYQGSPAVNVDESVGAGFTFSSTGVFVISMTNNPPQSFSLISPSNNQQVNTKLPSFSWNVAHDNDVGASVSYSIFISTSSFFESVIYSSANLVSPQITIEKKLFENRNYWWKVVAIDNRGASTASSEIFRFCIPVLTTPQKVAGLKTTLSPAATNFTLYWSETRYNTDGTLIDDLAGYNIYKALSVEELAIAQTYVHVNKDNLSFTDAVGGNYYYKIRSVDISGVESEDSPIIETFKSDKMFVESPDRLLRVEIPPVVVKKLLSENNEFLENLIVAISTEIKTGVSLLQFSINLIKPSGQKIGRYTFDETIKLKFEIPKIRSQAANSAPPNDSIRQSISFETNDIGLFWHNGVEFIKMPSYIDGNSVISNIANTGIYQIRQIKKVMGPRVTSISPPKVFTPGISPYEKIQFNFENPFGNKVTGEILDIKGRKICEMKVSPEPHATTGVLTWDGYDETTESLASKGIYLYQIKIGEKIINGPIVVAR